MVDFKYLMNRSNFYIKYKILLHRQISVADLIQFHSLVNIRRQK